MNQTMIQIEKLNQVIFFKPSQKSPFENYEEKRDVLEVLRQTLSNNRTEEDFIVKMDKEDRKSRR